VNVDERLLDAGRFFGGDHLVDRMIVREGALDTLEAGLCGQSVPFQERRTLLEHEGQVCAKF